MQLETKGAAALAPTTVTATIFSCVWILMARNKGCGFVLCAKRFEAVLFLGLSVVSVPCYFIYASFVGNHMIYTETII